MTSFSDTVVESASFPELEKFNDEFRSLMLNENYDALLEYYTEDIIIVPVLEPVLRGKNAVKEQYAKQKKAGVDFHSFAAETEKSWSEGNKIYEFGSYGLSGSTKDHPQAVARTGNYFLIWDKQRDGSYLMSFAMINMNHNPYN